MELSYLFTDADNKIIYRFRGTDYTREQIIALPEETLSEMLADIERVLLEHTKKNV